MTNWPNEMVAGGMAFDDSWLPAIIEANPLPNIRFLSSVMAISVMVAMATLPSFHLHDEQGVHAENG